MSFQEELIVTIVDKAAIGFLILIAGFFVNRALESFKSEKELKRELEKDRVGRKLQFLERQLSDFYWPIYLRLQKDNVVWRTIFDKSLKDDPVRSSVASEIEKNYILPNHDEIIETLEKHIHLANLDNKLESSIFEYVRHVAIYKALRSAGHEDVDPMHLGEKWPKNLFPLIETRLFSI